MSFINPSFLWAMFAVSVPIIIHLINFRRHKTLYFSNTSFLNDLKKETKTKTKLKQILILIARILTIAMLVFAFAGPFIPFNSDSKQKKSEINVIYLDNSFSMEAEGSKGQVFNQAKQVAKQIVYNTDAGMDYILITNDMLPEHQFAIDRDRFIKELDECKISSSSLSLEEVILKANTLVPDEVSANLYVLSDMQKSFIGSLDLEPNENLNMLMLPISSAQRSNIFIDSCWYVSPVHRIGQEEELVVRLVNLSDEDLAEIPVSLYINDSIKAISSLNIKANQTEKLSIKYVNTEAGDIYARLEISDYPVTYDNTLYFNYSADSKTRVLIINDSKKGNYLSSVYRSDPDNFILDEVKLGEERSSDFASYDLIILNNVSKLSSGLVSDIENFVTTGGSVTLIPDVEINRNSINHFLSTFNAGQIDDIKLSSKKIDYIDYENSLFKNVFINRNTQTDFPPVGLVYKYTLYNNSSFSSLISLVNSAPVFIAGDYKKGKVYVFNAPVSEINRELLKSPLFVPVFYNIAINSQITNSLFATIGNSSSIEISYPSEISSSDVFRLTDNKSIDAVAEYNAVGKNLIVFIPDEIKTAGRYKLYKGEKYISDISLNYNRKESKLVYYLIDELEDLLNSKFNGNAKLIDTNTKDISVELKEFSEGKPLWHWFLIFALIFIVIEVLLSRFLK